MAWSDGDSQACDALFKDSLQMVTDHVKVPVPYEVGARFEYRPGVACKEAEFLTSTFADLLLQFLRV